MICKLAAVNLHNSVASSVYCVCVSGKGVRCTLVNFSAPGAVGQGPGA